MSDASQARRIHRSGAELARIVVRIAEAAQAHAIICVTESESFPQLAADCTDKFRLIACKIDRAARRGRRVGCIFMPGGSTRVPEGARQLIPKPFQGHDLAARTITNEEIHRFLVELSKLDGVFAPRGDGFIQTARVFLAASGDAIEVAAGLGARHAGAAARTAATGVVVSATVGNARVYSEGQMALSWDPEIEHGPFAIAG